MSRFTPCFASSGLISLRISACGTGVAATVSVASAEPSLLPPSPFEQPATRTARAAARGSRYFFMEASVAYVAVRQHRRPYRRMQSRSHGRSATAVAGHQAIAEGLQDLHPDDQQRHGDQHVVGFVTVVTILVGQCA